MVRCLFFVDGRLSFVACCELCVGSMRVVLLLLVVCLLCVGLFVGCYLIVGCWLLRAKQCLVGVG